MRRFSETTLLAILDDYYGTEDTETLEALDSDDIDTVAEAVKLALNLYLGNITQQEYEAIDAQSKS